MTDTFEIKFIYDKVYQILNQPKRDFSYRIDDTYVSSCSYPFSDSSNIYLKGTDLSRDNWNVRLYPRHLKALEELCRRQHWRFVVCI